MLDYLRLLWFQIHKEKLIKLDPYVTVLVGPTNKGKSTILRALRWLALNRAPRGRYINFDSDNVQVDLHLTDGRVITRFKSDELNQYIINGEVLNVVGNKPNDAVLQILGMSDLNFQAQLDQPLWFLDTPGQVSKSLNHIVNLEVMDAALASIASLVRDRKTEKKLADKQLEEAKVRKRALQWVPEAYEKFQVIEDLYSNIQEKRNRLAALTLLLAKANQHGEDKRNAIAALPALLKVHQILDCATKLRGRLTKLTRLVQEAKKYRALKELRLPDERRLHDLFLQMATKTYDRDHLAGLIQKAKEYQETVWNANESVKTMTHQLETLTGGLCPICKSPLKLSSQPTSISNSNRHGCASAKTTGSKSKPDPLSK